MIRAHREPSLSVKLTGFAFQLNAVAALKSLPYAAVFHEQGLGKTKIGLDLVLSWLQAGDVDSALIVTKRSLVKNWQDEIRLHTHVTPKVLSQDRNANYYAFNSPARIFLTHYEVVASEEKRLDLFLRTRRVGILLDEAHKIKNPEAALTKALLRLSSKFSKRLIMTGTPVANRPFDLWAQIYFLDFGESLGQDFDEFKQRLDLSNTLHQSGEERKRFEDALSAIQGKISTFSARETKDSSGISLPTKTILTVRCDLEERQSELYDQYREEMRAQVIRENGLPDVDDAEDILKRLLRLVQVASNPALVDRSYKREPGKLAYLLDILSAARDNSEKAIVWTSFVDNAEWLCRRLGDFGAVVLHGGVDIDTRNSRIQRFKTDPEIRVLVATPGSAKEGLTLTVANRAVFFDRTFSLDDYLQSQDRIHRISQTRECYIHNLLGAGTVDEWVDQLLLAKQIAAQMAQGDISMSEFTESMSYDFGRSIREVLNMTSREEQPKK